MIRRCPAPLTWLAVVPAVILSAATNTAFGDSLGTATYTLTSPGGLPVPAANIAGPQVEALVEPPGGIVPPTNADGSTASPLQILSGSTGFDQSQLVVALKNTTSSTNQPEQMFGLVFFGQGLAAGGVLNFSLTTSGTLTSGPILESQTPGVTITLDSFTPSTSGSSSNGAGSGSGTPEPLSMLVWAILTGVGFHRVRAQRRARALAAA